MQKQLRLSDFRLERLLFDVFDYCDGCRRRTWLLWCDGAAERFYCERCGWRLRGWVR